MRVTIAGLFALVLEARWRKLDIIINSDSLPRGASRNPNLNLRLQKTQFKENMIVLFSWRFADRIVKLNGRLPPTVLLSLQTSCSLRSSKTTSKMISPMPFLDLKYYKHESSVNFLYDLWKTKTGSFYRLLLREKRTVRWDCWVFSSKSNFIMEKHSDLNLMKSWKTQTHFMLNINKNT